MMKLTLTASLTTGIAALACLPLPQSGPLAAQETAEPLSRTMNRAVITLNPVSTGQLALSWDSSPVSCDSGGATVSAWAAPHAQFAGKKVLDFPVTIGFSIDDSGRAVDIRVIEGGYVEGKFEASFDSENKTMRFNGKGLLESLATRDLMPSLRASLFAAGAPQSGCRVVYTPQYMDSADLPREALAAMSAVPGLRLSAAQRDRLGGGDCNTVGWPAPLSRAFPDWRLISATPGTRKWTSLSFDIDEQGVPANATVIASSGHDDLDAEGLRAVRESRFAEGPRTGCVTSWWRDPGTIPAAPGPDPTDFEGYRSCDTLRTWATRPRLTYPQAYNQRGIEGWAVLGFDIGADGAIGNVTVLAAQPSEEFGASGKAVLQSGRFQPSEEIHTRCVERVRFVKERPKAEPAEG